MLKTQIFKFTVGMVFIYLSACSFAKNEQSNSNDPKQQFKFAEKLVEEGDYNSAILEYKRLLYLYPEHKLNLRTSEEIKRLESGSPLRVAMNFIEAITQKDYEIAYGYLSKEIVAEVNYPDFADAMENKREELETNRGFGRFAVKENNEWKINFPARFLGIETIQGKEDVTYRNMGTLHSALSIHHYDTEGTWPQRLEDLIPKYIYKISEEKITGSNRVVAEFDGKGGWWYNKSDGRVRPNVKGKDLRGRKYKSWGGF